MKKILLIILFTLFLSNNVYAQNQNIEKLSSIIHGPFTTSLYKNGEIYFEENSDEDFPINFVLEYSKDDKINRVIIDRYAADGANLIILPKKVIDIEVVSLLLYTLKMKNHVFVIIRRGINHRAIGTYGDAYQVYAYIQDKDGLLKLDDRITKDNNLSGMDGISDWQKSHFKYKTANELRRYLKDNYG